MTSKGSRRLALLLGFFALLFLPFKARADFFDMYGIGYRAMSMGNAYTAVADDVYAVYYNPAGLAQLSEHEMSLGYIYSSPSLKMNGGPGPAQSRGPDNLKAPVIAMAFNLDEAFEGTLPVHSRFGLILSSPDNFQSIYRIYDPDPSTPHWYRYGDYLDRLHLVAGLSLQPDRWKWISFGAGVRFIISGKASMPAMANTEGLGINLGRTRSPGANFNMDVDTEIAPIAGVLLKPTSKLRFGYSFRGELELDVAPIIAQAVTHATPGSNLIDIPINLDIPGFNAYFLPQQHNFGLAYDWTPKLLTSLDISWFKWSSYRNPYRGGPTPKWDDTVVPRVGVEYKLTDALALRAGYFYEPSPVPNQYARSNYLDTDRHVFSWGFGYKFNDPLGVVKVPIVVDVAMQYWHLPSRTMDKNDPSLSDYSIKGNVVTVAGGITLKF